jgi:very-short-patch-repair endonuclease
MTFTEAMMFSFCLSSLMSAFKGSFWKNGLSGPKPRRPLPRKGPFRVKANPLKAYRPPRPDFLARAEACRAEQRAKAEQNIYEVTFKGYIDQLGFREGADYVWQDLLIYPGGYMIPDFHFRSRRIIFEIDGRSHAEAGQFRHDMGRDAYCRSIGIRVVRISNTVVRYKPNLCRAIVLAETGST